MTERGFDGASTQHIARMAGVSETSIFRHFGSKSELLSAAVIEPFAVFADNFRAALVEHLSRPWSRESLLRTSITMLYDALVNQRVLAAALVTSSLDPHASALRTEIVCRLEPIVSDLVRISRGHVQNPGTSITPLTARALLGMVVAMVAFEDTLGASAQPQPASRAAVIDELVRIAVHGTDPPRP